MTTILGIKLQNRVEVAKYFQEILSKHGCSIKTRIGLHEVTDGKCAPNGIILLEVIDENEAVEIEKDLLNIDNIEIQKMIF